MADLDDPGGRVEHDPFNVDVGQQRDDLGGRDDGAVGELAHHPGEGLVIDQHGDQGPRRPGLATLGGRPRRHLDERISPALRRGASEVIGSGRVAVLGPGGGRVGLEQGLFDPGQLVQEHRAVDRVEGPPHLHRPTERPRRMHVAAVALAASPVIVGFGIGQHRPIAHRPPQVTEPKGLGVLDQGGLIGHEPVADSGRVGPAHHIDPIGRHLAGRERLGRYRHRPQRPSPPQLTCGRRRRHPRLPHQARRGGLRPVASPDPPGIPHRQQAGSRRRQAISIPLDLRHRGVHLGIRQPLGVDAEKRIHGASQPLGRHPRGHGNNCPRRYDSGPEQAEPARYPTDFRRASG